MLKSLELFGFKSFADRTTFDFAEGITCVVGPNGSGKSNVVDALKWILGDQSAKSLRGKEMSDVIFNGSAGRKGSAFAEATLTFDNSNKLLPIDAAEVQIGRRLYASGDSEYLLNRSAVRLKDIREMFMGTGAGTAAYSIIEQGRVDQILQANPTARRLVFEEAAGISRYKARKVEAQRRLERVDQNLLRLKDIVEQLESRVNATRSQASKAAKYRELTTELRELWTGLAADDYRRSAEQLEEYTQQSETLSAQLTATDAQLTDLDQQLSDIDITVSQLDDAVRKMERRRSSGREEIAKHESTIRHLTTQQNELAAEIERLRHQRHVLRSQVQAVANELEESSGRLTRFQGDFAEQQQALEDREQRIEQMRESLQNAQHGIDKQRSDREQLQKAHDRHLREVDAIQSRQETLNEQDNELTARLQMLGTALAEAREELAERKQALQQTQQVVAEAQERIEQAQRERRRLRGDHNAIERQIALWREERSAKLARRHLLEDLEERQEGLNAGVRDILRRVAESRKHPWNLIRGNVGQLLETELDDAPLLEVALGARVQLLVIDRLAPLVDFLNNSISDLTGRAGFLELKRPGTRVAPARDLSSCQGVLRRADQLVTHCEVGGLAERLLADTWIVETLDTAFSLHAADGVGCRFVTLQGELLEADGTLFVGTAPNETAVISRKTELRHLRTELQMLSSRIATEEQRLTELDASLMESDGELQALQSDLNDRMELLAIRKSEHASQAAECGRLQAEIDTGRAEQSRLASQSESLISQLAHLEQTLSEQEFQREQLDHQISEGDEIARAVQKQIQQLQDETNTEQLQLAKHEERLSSLQAAHMRLMDDQRHRQQQTRQADAQLKAALNKQREMHRGILQARSALAEHYLADEAHTAASRGQRIELGECKTARKRWQKQQDSLREQQRIQKDALHRLEMQSRDLKHQMASLVEKIREEFQLELTDLVEQGVTCLLETRDDGDNASTQLDVDTLSDFEIEELTDNDSSDETLPEVEAVEDAESARAEVEERVEKLRRKIKNLGSINTESLDELDDIESRYTEMAAQLDDLVQAKAVLEDIIRRINVESRRLFLETFESIRVHFQELYRKLFGGGEGDIILEDPDDVLECGIDIVARPPGKELRSISLLSGGEKTMTAVGLLFAMFKSKPSPYCILDEVDAALDEANVDRYVKVVKEFRESTQFVIITHRKRTMTAADRLYGVTMEQAGVSKRLTVQFEDVSEDGHFRTESAAA
ncbi:MAG: chromosome segregation protein SMC [Planctomycetaceae bacterium]